MEKILRIEEVCKSGVRDSIYFRISPEVYSVYAVFSEALHTIEGYFAQPGSVTVEHYAVSIARGSTGALYNLSSRVLPTLAGLDITPTGGCEVLVSQDTASTIADVLDKAREQGSGDPDSQLSHKGAKICCNCKHWSDYNPRCRFENWPKSANDKCTQEAHFTRRIK